VACKQPEGLNRNRGRREHQITENPRQIGHFIEFR
jgi:hypothetical protein